MFHIVSYGFFPDPVFVGDQVPSQLLPGSLLRLGGPARTPTHPAGGKLPGRHVVKFALPATVTRYKPKRNEPMKYELLLILCSVFFENEYYRNSQTMQTDSVLQQIHVCMYIYIMYI